MYKKELTETQFIKDMKTVGVSEKDTEWHLTLYRKTKKLRENSQLTRSSR